MSASSPSFSVRVQAVLFKNPPSDLHRMLESLICAYTYDQNHEKSLSSLALALGDASPEPILTDEGIADWSNECSGAGIGFSYTFFDENTGYGKGHDLLSEQVGSANSTDLLLILNPDILLSPDFFGKMLSPFSDPSVGLTEARQTPIEHPKDYDPATGETPWSSGACFVIPAALFREAGGFDWQNFFLYSEDVDLSFRLRAMGKKLIYRPNVPVFHAKEFDADGSFTRPYSELRYGPEAQLTLAYKWRQKLRLSYLIRDFREGSEPEREALSAFLTRRDAGELTRLPPAVCKFFSASALENRYRM